LGGLDIMMIDAKSIRYAQIKNIANPFNSNYDDCSLVLGKKYGFLASNRKDGLGGFDVFSFLNFFERPEYLDYANRMADLRQGLTPKLEVDTAKATVSLPDNIITEDENDNYARILSYMTASFIYNNEVVFLNPDYQNLLNFSDEDKSLLEILYNLGTLDIPTEKRDSIQKIDEYLYTSIAAETRARIDSITGFYLRTSVDSTHINTTPTIEEFYKKLKIDEKQKIDRLIAMRLSALNFRKKETIVLETRPQVVEEAIKELVSNKGIISDTTFKAYERIVSIRLAGFLYEMPLVPWIESDYDLFKSLSLSDKSIMDMLYLTHSFTYSTQVKDSLKIFDSIRYQKLNPSEKEYVEKILNQYKKKSDDLPFVELFMKEAIFYNNLDIKQKNEIDRIIVGQYYKYKQSQVNQNLSALINETQQNKEEVSINTPNSLLSENSMSEFEKLISVKFAGFIYETEMSFTNKDNDSYNKLSIEDRSLVEVIHATRTSLLSNATIDSLRKSDSIIFAKLNAEEKQTIEKITDAYVNSTLEYVELAFDQAVYYDSLSLEHKKITDRLIANRLYARMFEPVESITYEADTVTYNITSEVAEPNGVITPKDVDSYERIISVRYAGHLYDIKLPFVYSDYKIQQLFTLDDRSIVDMMLAIRLYKTDNLPHDSLQKIDDKIYEELGIAEKSMIDRIVEFYFHQPDTAKYLSLDESERMYYDNLSIEKKSTTDRLIANRLKKMSKKIDIQLVGKEENNNVGVPNEVVDNQLLSIYERILSVAVAGYVYGLRQPLTDVDYKLFNGLSLDDKSIVEMLYYMNTYKLTPNALDSLRKIDKLMYTLLEQDRKNYVDGIVDSYLNTPADSAYVPLNVFESEFYNAQVIEDKKLIDRLIAMQVKARRLLMDTVPDTNIVVFENDTIQQLFHPNEIRLTEDFTKYERLISVKAAGLLYDLDVPYTETDYNVANSLSVDEKSILEMMYKIKIFEYNPKVSDSLRNETDKLLLLSTQEFKNKIAAIVENYLLIPFNYPFVKLEESIELWYNMLPIPEKYKIDRLIVSQIHKILERRRILTAITPTNPINPEDIMTTEERESFEKILSVRIASYIYKYSLPFMPSDFNQWNSFSYNQKATINYIYSSRVWDYDSTTIQLLHLQDNELYAKLPDTDKENLEKIVLSYQQRDTSKYIRADKNIATWYQRLMLSDKQKMDRLIALRLSGLDTKQQFSLAIDTTLVEDKNQQEYDRLLSAQIAAYVYGIRTVYTTDDYLRFNSLTDDDRSIVDMLYAMETMNTGEVQIDSIKSTDLKEIEKLSKDDRTKIDKIVEAYLTTDKDSIHAKIGGTERNWYAALDIIAKRKTDRIIANVLKSKMFAAEEGIVMRDTNFVIPPVVKEIVRPDGVITPETYAEYEKILSVRFAAYVYGITSPLFTESDYKINKSFNLDNISILDMMFRLKVLKLSKLSVDSIKNSDKKLYEMLNKSDATFVEQIKDAYNTTQENTPYVSLSTQNDQRYKNLNIEDKEIFDRLIVMRLKLAKEQQKNLAKLEIFRFYLKSETCGSPNVSGIFYDTENKLPVSNITVEIKDEQNKIFSSAKTSSDGSFSFSGIHANKKYTITAQISLTSLTAKQQYIVDDFAIRCSDKAVVSQENIISQNVNAPVTAENIYFDFNRYRLTHYSKKTLDKIVMDYKKNSNIVIVIRAYTDAVGSEKYNLTLSEKRAIAARNYMIENGVKKSSIQIKPEGKTNPIAPNSTEQGRSLNRRVEFSIISL